MKENNIEVCCFPPHCTHILQPLDDVPYAALKSRYQKELMTYNFKVAGACMTRTQFFCVLVPAFTQAFTSENIRKGFENTGIYPINPKAKKVQETGPSAVTDKCKSRVVVGPLMFWALLFFQIFVGISNWNSVSVSGWKQQAGQEEVFTASGSHHLIGFYLLLQMHRVLQPRVKQQRIRVNVYRRCRMSRSSWMSKQRGQSVVTPLMSHRMWLLTQMKRRMMRMIQRMRTNMRMRKMQRKRPTSTSLSTKTLW